MRWTREQKKIFSSEGDMKINAVAGSGKTTSIIEFAKRQDSDSQILYLAFNKSVKLEASKIFMSNGLTNVVVETAHSLAYKETVFRFQFKVKSSSYTTHELASILSLPCADEKHGEYIIAKHVNKFAAYFCNNSSQKVEDLDYLKIVKDQKARSFVKTFYPIILRQTRILLAMMNSGQIAVTHDFYLKKYQLSKPHLNFDYILFDEGQDASPVMLDIFFRQSAVKIIVGDQHQQIYAWRYAVNSLELADFDTYTLSTSFRFREDIAKLAVQILSWKEYIGKFDDLKIIGRGGSTSLNTKAVIARTNLGLLLKAIEYVSENEEIGGIYFEGNITSYTYAEEGASLYDILSLYNGKRNLIRDPLIKTMKTIDDLEEYVEKTEEVQLGLMIEIVKEYGNRIPGILKDIRDLHVEKDDKDEADLIFSTVHKCKGMEYDSVQLVDDFISEDRLKKITEAEEAFDSQRLNEEINLLYVAITRTRNKLYIPKSLMPDGFEATRNIIIITEGGHREGKSKYQRQATKSFKVNRKRTFQKWTQSDDQILEEMYAEGLSVFKIAHALGRSPHAVTSRMRRHRFFED